MPRVAPRYCWAAQPVPKLGLRAASRIAVATGAQILIETFPARLQRGAGLPSFERLGYFAEHATEQLRGTTQLVLAGAVSPVSFFAYPGKPSDLAPEGAAVTTLASVGDDVAGALEAVAELVAPGVEPVLQEANPAGAAERASGRSKLGRRDRRPAARRRHHLRRGGDFRLGDPDCPCRSAAPRRAHAHRRCHRPGHPGGDGRRCGSAGATGDQSRSRRKRDVQPSRRCGRRRESS